MANKSRIIQSSINLATARLSEASFSDAMIIGDHSLFDQRVELITSLAALAKMGFKSTDPIYIAASQVFSQSVYGGLSQLYIGRKVGGDTAESWTDAVTACSKEAKVYGMLATARTASDQIELAKFAEANDRLYVTATSDSQAGLATSTTDVLAQMKANNYLRTAMMYDPLATSQYVDAAWVGKMFSQQPGSENWANQRLASVTSATLDETVYKNIINKNGNTFEAFDEGVSITQQGITVGGEWIDVIRGRDWLNERIKTRCFSVMIDRRIFGNDDGIQIIGNQLMLALSEGQSVGFIDKAVVNSEGKVSPGFTITLPTNASRSSNDRASRWLSGVKWTARLAGALNGVTISGTLNYDTDNYA